GIEYRMALLKPVPPAVTLLRPPLAATDPLTSTSARRSTRSSPSSLALSPIQSLAVSTAVSVRLTSYVTVALDILPTASVALTTKLFDPGEDVSIGLRFATVPAHPNGPEPPSEQV